MHAARLVADERPAADALALLGGLEQERRAGAAQLQERGDGRLAVLDERLADRDEVVACSPATPSSATAAKSTSSASARLRPRRAQQHGEVVEDVGGLLGHALVGLLAGGAGDLLGLLLDLLADPPGRAAAPRCTTPPAARVARSAIVRSSPGSDLVRHRRSRSPLWKQVRSPVWQAGPAGSTSASTASRSQSKRSALTACVLPDVAPLCHSSSRERLHRCSSPVSRVRASASAFM